MKCSDSLKPTAHPKPRLSASTAIQPEGSSCTATCFSALPHLDRAVAANAGWYTYPSDTVSYPYGAQGSGADIKAYYGKKMIILLGDADTLRTSSLRQTPETDAQGLTRLARGNAFFSFCHKDAQVKGIPFNWRKEYVKGVGHSNTKMAPSAATLLFNGATSDTE